MLPFWLLLGNAKEVSFLLSTIAKMAIAQLLPFRAHGGSSSAF
jgi:hypothetical protein